VHSQCTPIFLFSFSYIEIYNKNFSKDSGLVEIESWDKPYPKPTNTLIALSYYPRFVSKILYLKMS